MARRHPVRVLYGPNSYYLRAVYSENDSRAAIGTERAQDDELPALLERFPMLQGLMEDHKRVDLVSEG